MYLSTCHVVSSYLYELDVCLLQYLCLFHCCLTGTGTGTGVPVSACVDRSAVCDRVEILSSSYSTALLVHVQVARNSDLEYICLLVCETD